MDLPSGYAAFKDEGKLKIMTHRRCGCRSLLLKDQQIFPVVLAPSKGLFVRSHAICFQTTVSESLKLFLHNLFLQTLSFGNASSSESKQGIWYKSDSTGSLCLPNSSTDGEKDWWTDSRWHTAEQEVSEVNFSVLHNFWDIVAYSQTPYNLYQYEIYCEILNSYSWASLICFFDCSSVQFSKQYSERF